MVHFKEVSVAAKLVTHKETGISTAFLCEKGGPIIAGTDREEAKRNLNEATDLAFLVRNLERFISFKRTSVHFNIDHSPVIEVAKIEFVQC